MLTWSENCVIFDADIATAFPMNDLKRYVEVVNLSAQYNTKLLEPLSSGPKDELTETNINQTYQHRHKITF